MQYEKIQAKSLLSKLRYGDSWFHSNRSMNSYRGCEHGCVYCDGNCQYYRIDDFYTHIRIKENAPQILRKELERAKYRSQRKMQSRTLVRFLEDKAANQILYEGQRKIVIGISGGVSDAYQQAEEKYKISRQVLETLADFRLPVFILTKSNLVLRDLDLLKAIHQQAFVNVCFSITLHDEKTRAIFEPKSSTPWERFEALKQIRNAGMFGGVMAYPTIPVLGDTIENMLSLAKEAKKAHAEFIMFAGLTLKPGRQKDYFFNVVRKRVSHAHDLLQQIYANNHIYGHPIFELLPTNVMIQGYKICQEVGISDRSIRHMMPNEPKPNVQVLNALLDLVFYRSMTLSQPRRTWQKYLDLAVQIEKGVDNLEKLQKLGQLGTRLQISPPMIEVIEEILKTGTFQKLTQAQNKISALGEKFVS